MQWCCRNCAFGDNPFSNFPGKVLCMRKGWAAKGKHMKSSFICRDFIEKFVEKSVMTTEGATQIDREGEQLNEVG